MWKKRRFSELLATGMPVDLASVAAKAEAEARWRAAKVFGKVAALRATVDFTDHGGALVRGLTKHVPPSKFARATRPTINLNIK